jgi:hypothetical protein
MPPPHPQPCESHPPSQQVSHSLSQHALLSSHPQTGAPQSQEAAAQCDTGWTVLSAADKFPTFTNIAIAAAIAIFESFIAFLPVYPYLGN